MSDTPVVSICIPVYYSGPEVLRVLDELLASIEEQDYPMIDICVSIQETSYEDAMTLCEVMTTRGILVALPKAEVDSPAKNTNHVMSLASNEGYIKIMNQDDFLDNPTAISDMVDMLESSEAKWLVNSCIHTDAGGVSRYHIHNPFWPEEKGMVEGVNRFGCPSVAMFEAGASMRCDPNMLYAMDCDMWIQLYREFGAPVIRMVPDVVIRMWAAQLSKQLNTAAILEREKIYMRAKYGHK